MNLEGKVMGYSKKTLVWALTIILGGGIIFYAGAKYEKSKLAGESLLKGSGSSTAQVKQGAGTKKGSKKNSQNISGGTNAQGGTGTTAPDQSNSASGDTTPSANSVDNTPGN